MASVNVLCPSGRRVTVKLGPNSPMMQVLEQVCTKQKLDASQFVLKHGKTTLDLSCPFRYSGLTNNAKLELVQTDLPRSSGNGKQVTLVVQTNQGKRARGSFNPSSSLWDVLSELDLAECERGLEPVLVYMRQQVVGQEELQAITLKKLGLAGGGATLRLGYQQQQSSLSQTETEDTQVPTDSGKVSSLEETVGPPPHLRQDSKGDKPAEDQNQPTLKEKSLGTEQENVDDNQQQVLETYEEAMECGVKPTETSEEAMETCEGVVSQFATQSGMPQFPVLPFSIFPEEVQPPKDSLVELADNQDPPPLFIEAKVLQHAMAQSVLAQRQMKQVQPAVVQAHITVQRRVYEEPCNREVVVFHLDDLPTTPTNEELPSEFFEVTKEDLQLMHRDLQRQVKQISGAPLVTRAMRVRQGQAIQYSRAVVRVHLPDRWVLQGCFRAGESLKALVEFIKQHLSNQQTKFHLYTAPPKEILRSGRLTFAEAGFVPAVLVHMAIDDAWKKEPLLSQDCLKQFHKSHQEAELLASRGRSDPVPITLEPLKKTTTTSKATPQAVTQSSTTSIQKDQSRGKPIPKWFKLGPK